MGGTWRGALAAAGSDREVVSADVATLVLTVIGDDQSGLVDRLSGVVVEHGGNWDQSHMSRLGGKFAGIVMLSVPDNHTVAFMRDLEPLESEGLLDITVVAGTHDSGEGPTREMTLDLVGHDRPGIVHEVSHALAERGVGIRDLQTATTHAPMAGGMLFEAHAVLQVPADLPVEELRDSLETLANHLVVDIDLHEA